MDRQDEPKLQQPKEEGDTAERRAAEHIKRKSDREGNPLAPPINIGAGS